MMACDVYDVVCLLSISHLLLLTCHRFCLQEKVCLFMVEYFEDKLLVFTGRRNETILITGMKRKYLGDKLFWRDTTLEE